jgi:hypothetical protein
MLLLHGVIMGVVDQVTFLGSMGNRDETGHSLIRGGGVIFKYQILKILDPLQSQDLIFKIPHLPARKI